MTLVSQALYSLLQEAEMVPAINRGEETDLCKSNNKRWNHGLVIFHEFFFIV